MYKGFQIVQNIQEYITVEKNKCNSAIYNHIKLRSTQLKLIELYEAKLANGEDIPNLQYLIDDKKDRVAKHTARITHYQYEIYILNLIPTRARPFMYILKLLNKHITQELLKGGVYLFPLGIGKIRVLALTSKPNLEIIDWSKSMENIESIAKAKDINLYKQYKAKTIQKFEFIQAMKQYLYPYSGGQRWIIYNLNKQRFFVKYNRGLLKSQNKYYFKFKVTSFANFAKQNLPNLIKNFNSHTEIINSDKLGMRTKLSLLEFYYPHLKQYYNDLSND